MSRLIAGRPVALDRYVRRLVAPNPGMMTGPGTNSYLVGDEDVTVIDPGPAIDAHVRQIAELCDGRLRRILVTHTHRDHSPAAMPLAELTGADVYGMQPPATPENDHAFRPTHAVAHDDDIDCGGVTVRAIHTPGHASNHVCYLLADNGMLFTGDHIMNGSTVVIAAPDGNMRQYLDSLELLKRYAPRCIAPGHGELLDAPEAAIDWIVAHRLEREAKVMDRLGRLAPCPIETLLPAVYDEVDPALLPIARYSLLAHLEKLAGDGVAVVEDDRWRLAAAQP